VIVVVATTPHDVAAVRARLAAYAVDVVAPSASRRLVRTAVDDEWEAERVVSMMRGDGQLAVARPADGARLDAWIRHTRPLTFGDRLAVCFAWSEHDRSGLPTVIELGLGGFGNGEHPATKLLIELLAERIVGGERVLDVGCGSGVLGLCAVALGASRVVAVDIKPEAIEATRRNAALNRMDDRVETCASLSELDEAFDVVVANIGRAAIVELAPQLTRSVAARGWLAISGISESQCSQIVEYLHPLVEVERRTDGEWSAVVLGHSTFAAAV
jgi:ribosomal protein L11 methyltransferase